jgi:hypothetical protein
VTVRYDVLFSQSLSPTAFVIFNRTLYVPVVNTVDGFWLSELLVSLAYQYQSQLLGVPELDVLVKVTPFGVVPDVELAEKAASIGRMVT